MIATLLACVGCSPLVEGDSAGLGEAPGGTTMTPEIGSSESGEADGGTMSMGGDGGTTVASVTPTEESTSSGATGSDTAATDGDESGVGVAQHDGTYEGTLSWTITVTEYAAYQCDGTASFSVQGAGAPQVSGEGSCFVSIPELGGTPVEITATAQGSIESPNASGTITFAVPLFVADSDSSWTGSFTGDTFSGSTSGATQVLGYPVTYDGTWSVQR
jgi:hypothetical protein